MSEFDSIKRFNNCVLVLIISCFMIVLISEVWFLVSNFQINIYNSINNQYIAFHLFIVYFLIDILRELNNEKELFVPKHYKINVYRVVRFVKFY